MTQKLGLLVTLLFVPALSAQAPGDSVRVRIRPSADWQSGRLVLLARDSAVVRQFVGDRAIAIQPGSRVEVWRRKNPAATIGLNVLIGAAAGAGLQAAFGKRFDGYTEGQSIGLAAVGGASTGLVIGVIEQLFWPGKWKRVR